jgi:hypothetical protein
MSQFLALWFVLGAGHRCWPVCEAGLMGPAAIARFAFIARVTVRRSLISKGLRPLATFARCARRGFM